jgi:hypothetical protein
MEYTDQYIDGRQVVIIEGPFIMGNGATFEGLHLKFTANSYPIVIDGYGLINNCVIDRQPT